MAKVHFINGVPPDSSLLDGSSCGCASDPHDEDISHIDSIIQAELLACRAHLKDLDPELTIPSHLCKPLPKDAKQLF